MSKITSIIAELAKIDAELIYREQLLDTVSEAAQVLLTANEDNELVALKRGMEIVGKCVSTDRVQIWRNEMINGELHFVMRYEWLSAVGETKKLVPLGLKFPYSSKPGWLERFESGKSINSKIADLPAADASFLGYYEMVSIVCMPMFSNNELIGFFSVDDCVTPRVFTEDEMKMFATTGLMFSNMFARIEQNATIKRRSGLLSAMNRATHYLFNATSDTFYNALQESMRGMAIAMGIDRVFIFKNFKIDGIPHCTQMHEWVGAGINALDGGPLTTDVSYYDSIPLDWHDQLKRGEIIHGVANTFPEKAMMHFIAEDVVSAVYAPIIREGEFWGFIGINDCRNERYFTKDELEIVRSFGLLFINVVEKGKKEDAPIVNVGMSYMGKRVLLVEDIELNRDIVKALLSDSGIIIDCAENGEEAVNMLMGDEIVYDMVLMDLGMPVMDGYEATRRIRKKHSSTVLPIIALTANINMEVIDMCNAVGMNDFINKPIDVEKLYVLLRNAAAQKM